MPDTVNTNNVQTVPEYKPTIAIIQIVISFLCCGGVVGAVFAILALVEGNKVKGFVAQGNMEAAQASLDQANKWSKFSWIAIAICMVLVALYFIFVFGASFLSAMAGNM